MPLVWQLLVWVGDSYLVEFAIEVYKRRHILCLFIGYQHLIHILIHKLCINEFAALRATNISDGTLAYHHSRFRADWQPTRGEIREGFYAKNTRWWPA